MADEFDMFLARELAPAEGHADRAFVSRVEARVAIEQRLEQERRATIVRLGRQILALAAVAVGVWLIGRAPAVANWFAESQALGLGALIAGFALLTVVLGLRTEGETRLSTL